ncbi:hypothetical protein AVEN_101302-1 [Araneus ventricosus]|uniref:Uncharacterized protein n=1 Tax=Araneus ventricosus TaxID=182803 RepID=A0A4Y2ID89_ARAVE|nr:hypothetical protein AVEN_101302-1 [Araneus ventricosus]
MCPVKCVTPHSGSVVGRTDFLAHSKKSTSARKVEGGSSPIRPDPHRVQWNDLSYFCGEVRNTFDMQAKLYVKFSVERILECNLKLGPNVTRIRTATLSYS